MKRFIKFAPLAVLSAPLIASAQLSGAEQLIRRAGELVELLTIVVAGIALLVFFWGLVKFIASQSNESSKADAKKIMGWGIIALFVMISIWGIIYFIGNELFPTVSYDDPRIPLFQR